MREAEPLEEDWRGVIESVARAHGHPTVDDPQRLGALVAALSAAYNGAPNSRAPLRSSRALAARLSFSFPRDVPKSASAVRELVAAGLLRFPLRVLDLGAGLGASTWGVVRALAATGARGAVDALLVDDDDNALEVARAIAKQRPREAGIDVQLRTQRASAESVGSGGGVSGGPFDIVLLGQLLSELDSEADPSARVVRHADWLIALRERFVTRDGALVVIEPALRNRTRHLQAVRDVLLARDVIPFAPCLHALPCPMLTRETDWCHEDRPVDLPPWLVPVARAAGLRWQGLTFSYLVLRKDGVRLVDTLRTDSLVVEGSAASGRRLRLVSDAIVTKGKAEVVLCGEDGALLRARRLDREASPNNADFEAWRRGDVVRLDPPESRIRRETSAARIDVKPLVRS